MITLEQFKACIGTLCLISLIAMVGCTQRSRSLLSVTEELSKPNTEQGHSNSATASQVLVGTKPPQETTSPLQMSLSLTKKQAEMIDSEIKDVYRCIDES